MAVTAEPPVRKRLTLEEQRELMAPRYVPKAIRRARPPELLEPAEPEETLLRPWPTHEELLAQRLAPLARPSPERGLVAAIERGDEAALPRSMKPHTSFLQRELQRTKNLISDYQDYIIDKYDITPERFKAFTPPSKADIELGKEICTRQYNFIRAVRYGTPEMITWEEEARLAEVPFRRPPVIRKFAPR